MNKRKALTANEVPFDYFDGVNLCEYGI